MPLTYEEIRDAMFDVLSGQVPNSRPPSQWAELVSDTAGVINRRFQEAGASERFESRRNENEETCREIFWDLFRQGYVQIGLNSANPSFPFFKVSRVGRELMHNGQPFRFHNAASYIRMLESAVPDVDEITLEYIKEAINTFYTDNLLSCSVMLGVAAEHEFDRFIDVASGNERSAPHFRSITNKLPMSQRIRKFRSAISGIHNLFDETAIDDIGPNIDLIQAVIRVARNEAGHPTARALSREQTYVHLQLFIPFAKQLFCLREALAHPSGDA